MRRSKPLAFGRWPLAVSHQRSAVSRRVICAAVVFAVALALLAGVALANGGFEIPWFTADGGGATTSAGGDFALGGTAGQTDAGMLSGGGYTLAGGFWPGAEVLLYAYLPVIMR